MSQPNPVLATWYQRFSTIARPSKSQWHSRSYLPHFEAAAHLQMITYRLADSLPAEVTARWQAEVQAGNATAEHRRQIETYADSGCGSCALQQPEAAQIVREIWHNRNEQDYRLHAWVIMPNHVHVLLDIFPERSLSKIVEAWKSVSARRILALSGQRDRLWQKEYWDRYIRTAVHYERAVSYIYENPVSAGLVTRSEDWVWSSWGEAVHESPA